MIAPVKTILFGVTDPSQAAEAALLGVDGVIVAVGPERGESVPAARAGEVFSALPPLTARWALLEAPAGVDAASSAPSRRVLGQSAEGRVGGGNARKAGEGSAGVAGKSGALPPGCTGAVTARHEERPPGALVHLLRLGPMELDPEGIPSDVDGAWVRPDRRAGSSATAFDFRGLEKLARRLRLMLEIPEGAAGVETAVRLGRPYALIFGESVWCHPGIVDLDRLETAMGVVARLNKAAYL